MAENPDTEGTETTKLPPELRFLKTLVTVLTGVMILGVITIVTLLVIRLSDDPSPELVMPDEFQMPEGIAVTGYSQIGDQVVIVGNDRIIRVFDAQSRMQTQSFDLND